MRISLTCTLLGTLLFGSSFAIRAAPSKQIAVSPAWTAWSPLKDGYKNSVDLRWRHEGDYLMLSLHNRYDYEVAFDVDIEIEDAGGKKSEHVESYALKPGELNEDKNRHAIGVKVMAFRIMKMTATHPQWGELEVVPRNKFGEREDAEAKILADTRQKQLDEAAKQKNEAAGADGARAAVQKALPIALAAEETALQKAFAWEDDPNLPRVYPKVELGDRYATIKAYVDKIKDPDIFPYYDAKLDELADAFNEELAEQKKAAEDSDSNYTSYVNYVNQQNSQPNTAAGRISAQIAAIAAQNALNKHKELADKANELNDDLGVKDKEFKDLQQEARDMQSVYTAAWTLKKEGKLLDAEWAFRELLRSLPQYEGNPPGVKEIHVGLELVLAAQKRYPEAESEWQSVMESGGFTETDIPQRLVIIPEAFDSLREQGNLARWQNHFTEAEKYYRSHVANSENNPDNHEKSINHYLLALDLSKEKKLADAELEARKALALEADAPTHRLIGDILTKSQKWNEAETEYRAASKLNPKNDEIAVSLGDVLMQQQKWADAETAYASAVQIAPKWPSYRRKLGDALLKEEKWPDAETQYREGLKLQADNPYCHAGLGEALYKQGKLAESTPEFKAASIWLPQQFLFTGADYLALKRFAIAESLFRTEVASDSDNAWAHHRLADTLNKQLRTDEAITEEREAARLDPKSSTYPNMLGILLNSQGKNTEAEAAFRDALKISPDDGVIHANLAGILLSLKRDAEALEEGKRAIALGTKDHHVFKELGLTP